MIQNMCRGKRLDNGEWVEGYLIELLPGQFGIAKRTTDAYVTPTDDNARWNIDNLYCPKVDPNTVGRCTGVADRNGIQIFEGDIVRHYNDMDDKSVSSVGAVFWDQPNCTFKRNDVGSENVFRLSTICEYDVIGNMYDCPELLNG